MTGDRLANLFSRLGGFTVEDSRNLVGPQGGPQSIGYWLAGFGTEQHVVFVALTVEPIAPQINSAGDSSFNEAQR